jgi:hypothetical protein
MSNQLSGKPVNVGAPEIVKFFASETENRRTDDSRYANTSAIEDISVHRKISYFPFAFSHAFRAIRLALYFGSVANR